MTIIAHSMILPTVVKRAEQLSARDESFGDIEQVVSYVGHYNDGMQC